MNEKRRKFLDDIKILKDNHKSLREFAEEKYIDENGVANIHIYTNKTNIYNSFTNPNQPEISNDVFSYIDNESYFIPTEYPIRIVFHSEDDLDVEYIENKIKEYYFKKLADKEDDLKRNKLISIVLFAIGIVFLSAFFVLENLPETKDVFNEIFSIIGSFSIWESVDYFLINRNAIKIDYLNTAQLALITVKVNDNEVNQ